MTILLHIDASAQTDRSIYRKLSAKFIESWMVERSTDKIIRRDLSVTPPGFVTGDWIAACFTPEDQRTQEIKKNSRRI